MSDFIVAFDDVALQLGDTGIARYWKEVIGELQNSNILKDIGVRPIFLNRSDSELHCHVPHIEFPKYNFTYPAADRKLINAFCKSEQVDLFVSSYYTFATSSKNMLLVYDLIPEVYNFSRMNRGWMERELSLHAATSIFAISENTKNDLKKYYPHTGFLNVSVGYPGIDLDLFNMNRIKDGFKETKNQKYFVCLGSRYGQENYKNGELVVRALQSIPKEMIDFDLIFIGGEELTESELDLVKSKGVSIVRKHLDDKELVKTLSQAAALIYPSKYEGFGMPPLEALAVGTPIITTNKASIPEVVGDLSLFVAENDHVGLARLLTTTDFEHERARISQSGPERAAMFSWQNTAQLFGAALSTCLNEDASESWMQKIDFIHEYSKIAENLQH